MRSDGKQNTVKARGMGGGGGGVRIVALSIILRNRLNKIEFAVFSYCRFSLFLKHSVFPDYFGANYFEK